MGGKRGGRLERLERLGEAGEVEQQFADVDLNHDKRRVESERLSIEPQRGLGLAALAQHVSAHAEGVGEIRPKPQRVVEASDRFLAPPLAPQPAGGGVERVGFGA